MTDDPLIVRWTPLLGVIRAAIARDDRDTLAHLIGPLSRNDLVEALIVAVAAPPRDPSIGFDKMSAIFTEAAETCHIDRSAALNGARDAGSVSARRITCYAGHLLGFTYSDLGRFFALHHTTVMHSTTAIAHKPAELAAARRIAAGHGWRAGAAA